jgi:hypothetical protein
MTHRRALAFIAGVLTFFSSVFVAFAGLAFILLGIWQITDPWGGSDSGGELLATGIYGLVGASLGLVGGVRMVRARSYRFCITGAVLLCSAGLLPFVLDLDEEYYFPAAYLLVLMVPAVALLVAAGGDFIEPAPRPARGGARWGPQPWPGTPPGIVWPPSPGAAGPSPPPGTYRAVPPPPPPPYLHPNPPRPFYIKDVGQARADRAGACMTLGAAFLVFFGMMGVLWPNDLPGSVMGLASLLGAIMGLVAAYLALLRIRKLVAWVTGFYALLAYAMLTIGIIDADGLFGLLLFLPLLALLAVGLVSMGRAYRTGPRSLGAPMPVPADALQWRP